jgi:TolA-binding protein
MGKRTEARDAFQNAITGQLDKFAVSEASYHLGLMALEDGDTDEARRYFTTGAEEVGEGSDSHRQMCRDKLLSDFS